jgi:hypothetical protein
MKRRIKMSASIKIVNGVFQGRMTEQKTFRDLYLFIRSDARGNLNGLEHDIKVEEERDEKESQDNTILNPHYYAHFIVSDNTWTYSDSHPLSFGVSNFAMNFEFSSEIEKQMKRCFTFFVQDSVIENKAGLQLAIVTHYGVEGLYVLRSPEDANNCHRWVKLTVEKLEAISHSYHTKGVCGRHRKMIPKWL